MTPESTVSSPAPSKPPKRPRPKRITDGAMRRIRIVALIVVTIIALPAFAFGIKFVSVNALADAEQTAYQRRAWSEAEAHARGLMFWNFVEEWKAHYNLGAALGMAERFDGARSELNTALELVPESETNARCIVLTNLVYVVEKQGDAAVKAHDRQAANGFYHEALALIEGAPEGCFVPPETGQANTKEQLEAAAPRIRDKIVEDPSGGGGDDQQQQPQDPRQSQPPQTPEQQLQQQNQHAQQQQEQQQQYEQGSNDEHGSPPPVDKPW